MPAEPTPATESWKARFRVPVTLIRPAGRNRGRGLAVSNRTGVFQLYAWEPDSAALAPLTDEPKGRVAGVIAPDGAHVYYLKDADGNELGHWVRVPFAGGPPQDVTPSLPPYASWELSASADGARVALSAADEAGFHLYVVDFAADGAPGAPHAIFHSAKMTGGVRLSPDGATVIVGSSERSATPQFSLLALDAAGGARRLELWDGADTSVEAVAFGPLPADTRLLAVSNRSGVERPLIWDTATGERRDLDLGALDGAVEALGWSPDGASVLLSQLSNAVQRLYVYDLAAGTARRLDHPSCVVAGAAFLDDGTILANVNSSTMEPQVVALDAATGAIQRVLVEPGAAPASRPLRSVSFTSSDGTPIQGWLGLPAGAGPFPTIVEMHGGPAGVDLDSYEATVQMWLDHGFAYLNLNYRGSVTFGRAFQEQIYGDLGHWELEDMAAARAWLIREGVARPDEMMLTGWSYGGYLTLMGLGRQPELWAGGMAGVAIADWTIQYEDTAATLRGYQTAIFGGTPEQVPERYVRSSPITYAEQVRAPVLVIQGRNDTRCPARPMEQYEARLRALGRAIEVVWFDAGHGSYEVELMISHYERMLRFAQRVLG
jgi:dipeptidyl aminopeptidase/acylaminoacyl peptidase